MVDIYGVNTKRKITSDASGAVESLVRKALGAAFIAVVLPVLMVAAMPGICFSKDKEVVRVNGVVLTEYDVQEAINSIVPAARFHGGLSEEKREKYRPQAVEKVIVDELLFREAVRTGLKIPKSKVTEERNKTVERVGGKKKYRAALKQAGFSDRQFRKRIEKVFLIEEILRLEVEAKSGVSDDEAMEYYEENKKTFLRPEARRIRHIMVSVDPTSTDEERKERRSRAQEALDKIRGGEDMAEVAWNYSDDPYRVKGGDLGLIHKGRLVGSLQAEVFRLEEGELSGIIETIYGFHIARVEEITERQQLEFEEVSDRIKAQIKKRRRQELRTSLIERLKANAEIEVLE